MSEPINVIFLDFDGVLLNRNSWSARSGAFAKAAPSCVNALNRIIAATGAQIVVSSTLRKNMKRVELNELLMDWGVVGTVRGATPLTLDRMCGAQIQSWLDQFEEEGRDTLGQFVILDDDSDMGELTHRLVRTSHEVGLTEQDADRAIEILTAVPVEVASK